MSLIGLDEIGSRKQKRKEKRASNKEKRKKKREDRGGSRLKKVVLAPTRLAFFLLLKMNVFKLRTRLREAWKGGKKADIERKVIKRFGFKKSNFLRELNRKESEILSGALGEITAAAIAKAIIDAAPVIGAVGTISTALAVTVKNAKSALSPNQQKEFNENAEGDIPEPTAPPSGGSGSGESESDGDTPSTSKINPLLLLGGGALLVFILTKKK